MLKHSLKCTNGKYFILEMDLMRKLLCQKVI